MAASPTFLIAARPKRMPSGATVNCRPLALTSGARIGTCMSRHSPMYMASLSVFCRSIVSNAAMKCRG